VVVGSTKKSRAKKKEMDGHANRKPMVCPKAEQRKFTCLLLPAAFCLYPVIARVELQFSPSDERNFLPRRKTRMKMKNQNFLFKRALKRKPMDLVGE
jgi:hypothetical protein